MHVSSEIKVFLGGPAPFDSRPDTGSGLLCGSGLHTDQNLSVRAPHR